MQLEPANISRVAVSGGCIRGSLQKCSKSLAGADVTSLRARAELARVHIFDHTLTQRVIALVVIGNSCLG
jgi:hypothetical protein